MRKSRVPRFLVGISLLVVLLGSIVGAPATLAAEGDEGTEGKLSLLSKYPIAEGRSGDGFSFDLSIKWTGNEPIMVDLETTADYPEWDSEILGGYPQRKIFAVGLDSNDSATFTINFTPKAGNLPEPGDYSLTVTATAGDISEHVELTAKVIARYLFAFYTTSGRLNTEVTIGTENHFGLRVQNTGSTPVTDITFLVAEPKGWAIKFEPRNIDQVNPGYAAEVDLILTPSQKVVPGDYVVVLNCIGKEVGSREIELRVTVLTSTIWGWVGVIIVLLVIVGLIFMFRQLGRR